MAKVKAQKKAKRKIMLGAWITVPMLFVVMVQLGLFVAILLFGGEFRYVKQFAYSSLVEKTENRRNYIETELEEKMPVVQEYAERVNTIVAEQLKLNRASIGDLQTDRDLDRSIIEASVSTMVGLMRRAAVNDVYLILETGELYNDEEFELAKAALYLRDLDIKSNEGYDDLLMEMGYTSIARDFGITLDSGWSLYFMSDPQDTESFDFYYKTLTTAKENPGFPQNELGYWSEFSRPSRVAAASMKYSLPLIAEDGTVYGVIGVGLTENTILSNLPANDFMSEIACYVLGHGKASGEYGIVTHSGSSFSRLVGESDTLKVGEVLDTSVNDFELDTDVDLAGSVQEINLYVQDSPYGSEQWALISVADRASVLAPFTALIKMLILSSTISLAVGTVIVFLCCRGVIKPISGAIKVMNEKREYNQVIQFQQSNIYEIDKMTDAITQLQINVRDFSSQVSKMMSVADMGLGTFMYDRTDDSVFVGQSLLKMLKIATEREEDIVMSREDFIAGITSAELRKTVSESLELTDEDGQKDFTQVFSIEKEKGNAIWIRYSLIYTANSSIGVMQDITDSMLERSRIEYERDYDSLTGLINRHAYYQRIDELFHDRDKLGITAFVMIDLDNLKYVNDTYGHDFGDDYIKTAAMALKKFQSYGGIVSRISGDEFNICLPGFSSKEEIRDIIAEVRSELLKGSCLLADGTHFKIRGSMGVAWYPDDSDSYELLMKYADFAMYTIKHSTKGEVAEFDLGSYTQDSVVLTGVEEMNRIIDEGRVRYAFQCIISAKTGEVYGYEALMRIQSQIFQSPLELLRTAKTGAKLYEIERLTWIRAMADFQAQIDAGRISEHDHIFINSIGSAILEPSDEKAIGEEYSHLLDRIVIEILESENANEEYTAHKVKLIGEWGGQFALDDFGTGYNSEYALISVHPNIIKIDRSIISGCDKDVSRRMIINSLVRLARTQQINVLAEGVETEEEMKTVISCGVDLMQGYYFSHPLFEPGPIDPEIVKTIRREAKAAGLRKDKE